MMSRTLSERNQDVIARGDQREPDEPAEMGAAFVLQVLDCYAPPTADDDVSSEFAFEQFDQLTPVDLVRVLEQWQQRKECADAISKQVGKVFDFLRLTKIPTAFDEEGISLLKVDGIGRCSLTSDMYVSVAAGAKDEAFTWLRDTGRGDLIGETVNSSTLKAVIKKAILDGEQLPEGVFNVNPFTRASITHGK
jgi:hypothetical protein